MVNATMGEPTNDSALAINDRWANPGLGYCFRCGFTWQTVDSHVTNHVETTLESTGRGCFPLCETCWAELGCGEARIEYYAALIKHWKNTGSPITPEEERLIGKAVANGL